MSTAMNFLGAVILNWGELYPQKDMFKIWFHDSSGEGTSREDKG